MAEQQPIKRRTWDRELDFRATRKRLGAEYERRAKMAAEAEREELSRLYLRQGCYIGCYITQLVNAARISEAKDALELWTKSESRTVMIRSRKKGRLVRCLTCNKEVSARIADKFEHQVGTDGKGSILVRVPNAKEKHAQQTGHQTFSEPYFNSEEKRMTIPKEIREEDKEPLKYAFGTGISIGMLKVFALKTMGFNTHSLRFAGVTMFSEKAAKMGLAPETVANISGHSDLNELLHYQQKKAARKMQDMVALGTRAIEEEEEADE